MKKSLFLSILIIFNFQNTTWSQEEEYSLEAQEERVYPDENFEVEIVDVNEEEYAFPSISDSSEDFVQDEQLYQEEGEN